MLVKKVPLDVAFVADDSATDEAGMAGMGHRHGGLTVLAVLLFGEPLLVAQVVVVTCKTHLQG